MPGIVVALTSYAEMVRMAIAEGMDIIFSSAGLPLALPGLLKSGSKNKLVPIVSSAKAANIICKKWALQYNYLPGAVEMQRRKDRA